MKKTIVLLLLFILLNSISQKTDLRVEINNLKEDVKELQGNNKFSIDLPTFNINHENHFLDLGAKKKRIYS